MASALFTEKMLGLSAPGKSRAITINSTNMKNSTGRDFEGFFGIWIFTI
jgi:hypothetical protein